MKNLKLEETELNPNEEITPPEEVTPPEDIVIPPGGTGAPRIYIDGVYRDMTPEEIAEWEAEFANVPQPELSAEEALRIIMEGE